MLDLVNKILAIGFGAITLFGLLIACCTETSKVFQCQVFIYIFLILGQLACIASIYYFTGESVKLIRIKLQILSDLASVSGCEDRSTLIPMTDEASADYNEEKAKR